MEPGAAGTVVDTLVSFNPLNKLFPQLDVYATFTLSAKVAALLLVYETLITLELISPESMTALLPRSPVKFHNHPVAAATVDVGEDAGKTGAVYRYIFAPQLFVDIGVIVIVVGAVGIFVTTLVSFNASLFPIPHVEV